ncbi:hypothetical protein EG328_010733 [Venturia inaequalis]|uniref:Uncharacterized protein n=1 Tax=Venturia inaequalis TaxID=5025 RepID=A0A8H3U655_VENIN|nr:hypothetical protein EG328_010733 [Venturia inaequalis]
MVSGSSNSDDEIDIDPPRKSRSLLPGARSCRRRKRGTGDDAVDTSSAKSRKIGKEARKRQDPKSSRGDKSTAKIPAEREQRRDSPVREDATVVGSQATSKRQVSGQSIDETDNQATTSLTTSQQPTSPSSVQAHPASIPPPNGTSPFSRLPRELRQEIMYRVLDSDQEVVNRYALQFPRLATPEERTQTLRFRVLRQRRDALVRVEGEWGEVGLLWACEAEYIFQVVWTELMRAEPEVFEWWKRFARDVEKSVS